MVNVKHRKRQQVNIQRKKIWIFTIIFLLITTTIPFISIAETPPQETPPTITPIKTDTEHTQSSNILETTTSSKPWWNANWHYRRIYNTTGVGNISLSLNFTLILESLQVNNKTFENTTITIVRHYTNGTMIPVTTSWFNESTTFNNHTNAAGTLLWSISGVASYGIYFDVKENRGTRIPYNETTNITPSSSAHATLISTQGWYPEFSMKLYYFVNETIRIQVHTTALANNVTANFYLKGISNFNISLHSLDSLTWTNTTTLSKIGDWAIKIYAKDDANYKTISNTIGFYIGKPDLIATNLTIPTCYVGYHANISANILAVNTTVNNVTVSLRVNNINVDSKEDLTIQKNETQTLFFNWTPPVKGTQNVSFEIFKSDSNPGNNHIWKLVNVEGIPDLKVSNITVTPTPVNEGNPAYVTVHIKNDGDGNASNYTLVLYCEQNENNHTMHYLEIRDTTTFSLTKNISTNISLTWQQTRYGKTNFKGEWAIGVEILNTTQTPDKNDDDNKKPLYHALWVTPAERNPPLLSNLEYLITIEIGDQQSIKIKATDDSGIDTVNISIKTPNLTYVNTTMTPIENNRYEYLFTPLRLGRYNFTIQATDLSPNANQSIITGSFHVTEDQTPPTISYFGVNPLVQLPNHTIEIRCITTDYSGIHSVEVTIQSPDGTDETHTMNTPPTDTKYIYTHVYETTGKYSFTITVQDTLGNHITTNEKTFWITNNLNDTDNDGMPDDWEKRYQLNPYDPNDASQDQDNDGFTNIEEYQQGTDPIKNLASSTEILERLQNNLAYLTASLIVFIIIILLAVYGIWRRAP
jgi:hypothetical protein